MLVSEVYNEITRCARLPKKHPNEQKVLLIETAGGVLSPSSSGTPQAEVYRPLRLPAILVGDHRLGGIGATISAYEPLLVRGYDVDAIVMFQDERYGHSEYLCRYFGHEKVPVFTAPFIPSFEEHDTPESEEVEMNRYYDIQSQSKISHELATCIINKHHARLENIATMPSQAREVIWHPFAQPKGMKNSDIIALDSAYGDFFQIGVHSETFTPTSETETKPTPVLKPAYDG